MDSIFLFTYLFYFPIPLSHLHSLSICSPTFSVLFLSVSNSTFFLPLPSFYSLSTFSIHVLFNFSAYLLSPFDHFTFAFYILNLLSQSTFFLNFLSTYSLSIVSPLSFTNFSLYILITLSLSNCQPHFLTPLSLFTFSIHFDFALYTPLFPLCCHSTLSLQFPSPLFRFIFSLYFVSPVSLSMFFSEFLLYPLPFLLDNLE